MSRCRWKEAWQEPLEYFMQSGGGGVSASAVACLVGGQEEGRRLGGV